MACQVKAAKPQFRRIRLDKAARVVGGATPRTENSAYWNGDIAWATPKDLSTLDGTHLDSTSRTITSAGLTSCAAEILPPGSVLLSSRAPIGLTAINSIPLATNQGFKSLVPNPTTSDASYLYHWLRAHRTYLEGLGNGATFKEVSKTVVSSVEISIPYRNGSPDLDEQKRIAAILDKADTIWRKHKSSLRLVNELLRSLFLNIFGDPQINPKGWPIMPLRKGVLEFEGGRNFMPTETERRDGVRVLKVSAVTSGEYKPSESKSFSQTETIDPRHMVREGDLLISRANTAELVGAVAYVWSTSGKEMLPDKLWRFVWPEQRTLEPLFVLHLARSSYFRRELISRATGSSGSMKNIGKSKMLEIPIPFPPIELQKTFACAVSALQKLAGASKEALNQADNLFQSLQQRAFNGDLSR
jgi:type I restriction enzyme S subunit